MKKENKVTKRICSAAAMLLTITMLGGCSTVKELPLHELDVDKYVTLGDYSDVEITAELSEVNEEDWMQWLANVYAGYATESLGAVDRAIQNGDTANIDYEGKLDGVAFEGGTAQGVNLAIGSGRFIEGFEEGLVGVMPGETVVLPLTFPESYDNADLAGKEVEFTVTVNYVIPGNEDEMLDAVVMTMGMPEFGTVAGLKQYLYELLEEDAQYYYETSCQDEIITQLTERSTFEEMPEYLVEIYRGYLRNNVESSAAEAGVTVDTYTSYYYGMTCDEFVNTYVGEMLNQDVLLQAIANREGLTVGDDELELELQQYALDGGYSSVEEFLGSLSRDQYRNYLMSEKVYDFLMKK